jgi:hypothetical protein
MPSNADPNSAFTTFSDMGNGLGYKIRVSMSPDLDCVRSDYSAACQMPFPVLYGFTPRLDEEKTLYVSCRSKVHSGPMPHPAEVAPEAYDAALGRYLELPPVRARKTQSKVTP